MNRYHMKEQHFRLSCTMVKCLHKVHSERIRSEPADVKFRKVEPERRFEPMQKWLFLLS